MKILKSLALASAALFVTPGVWAQQSKPAPVEDTKVPASEKELDTPKGSPALWKLTDEDTTIYLFGTVHMLPSNIDWNTGNIKDALEASGSLVTELDLSPETAAEIGQKFQAKGVFTDGKTLRGIMTEEQRASYEAGLAKIGIPAEALDQFEPWFASIALLQIITQAAGITPEDGVETVLESVVAEGTERIALETVDFQISRFDELPLEQQVAYLLEAAADPLSGIETLNTMVVLWAKGDVEALGELINEGFTAHPVLAERLLYQRNANWAEWIDTRMDDPGTVFIAVGAGHLVGQKSVQELLSERGFETTRIQ